MTTLRRCSPEIERELHDKEARIRELEAALRPFVDAFGSQDWYRRRHDVNVLSEMLCLPVPITPDDIERACKELAAPAPPDSEPAEGAGGGYQRVLIDAANNVLDCLARPWELTTADLVAIRQSLQAVVHGEAPTYADDTTEQQDAMLERREALEKSWDEIKDRDPYDPLTQLEIMREKAEREGCGVAHQYNVIRHYLSRTSDEGTGCVVPESIRRLSEQWQEEYDDLLAGDDGMQEYLRGKRDAGHELDRAIAEQGGQR